MIASCTVHDAADLFLICTGYLGVHLTQVHLTNVNDTIHGQSHEKMGHTSTEQQFSGWYLAHTKQSFNHIEGEGVGEQLLIYPQLKGSHPFGQLQPHPHDWNVEVC